MTDINDGFILRQMHLDVLIPEGINLILGADKEYLYLCDWPHSKRHQQNVCRIARHLGCDIKDLGYGSDAKDSVSVGYPIPFPSYTTNENSVLDKTVAQLKEYFSGERRQFDIPIKTIGSEFQQKVWQRLATIDFGDTINYGQIAKDICVVGGCQAVGTAVGSNPISIIIPCHRVVAINGLGGYAGSADIKCALLQLEGVRY